MLRDRQKIWRRLNLLGDIVLTYGALLVSMAVFRPPLSPADISLLLITALLIWTIFLYGPSGSYF